MQNKMGRKPLYDSFILELKIGDCFAQYQGRYLTDYQVITISRRAKLLGIKLKAQTDMLTGRKKVYRVA
jgi:hypothetical protein